MDYNINNNKIMENDFNYETLNPSLISRIGRAPVTLSAGRGIAARSAPHTHRASKSSKEPAHSSCGPQPKWAGESKVSRGRGWFTESDCVRQKGVVYYPSP